MKKVEGELTCPYVLSTSPTLAFFNSWLGFGRLELGTPSKDELLSGRLEVMEKKIISLFPSY